MHTENEITPKASLYIWVYFFLFVILLYLIITGFTVYFKTEAEHEYNIKVGSVKSKALLDLRQKEKEQLMGIEEAMEQVVRESN